MTGATQPVRANCVRLPFHDVEEEWTNTVRPYSNNNNNN